MRNSKPLLSLLLVFFLVLSFINPSFANEGSETTTQEETSSSSNENREEITFDFDDSDEAPWAEEYIGKMQSKEVIKGYGDGTFKPNAPVTRLEAIVMAVRLMELEEVAKAKSSDTKLHFKDASQIPQWGRGHVIVALEKGLFNSTEDKIQPNKPASRVWIVQLLVKALGLEEEALNQMTNIPDFDDVNDIPAGSIGYVNIAVEQGITTGYGDNTFKPNQPVKRGEMAAFLDRTNDGLLEQSGAITVQGMITEISFNDSEADEVTSDETVTNNVYESTDGSITIQTIDRFKATYTISSNLLVQNHKQFILANQLQVEDFVTLIVQDGVVQEANLINQNMLTTSTNLLELKIELEYGNKEKIEMKYKNKKGKVEGEIETKSKDHKEKVKGQEAVAQLEGIIEQLSLSSTMTNGEMLERVLSVLQVDKNKLEELEIEVKFSNGKKAEIEFKNEDSLEEGYKGIQEFSLKIEQSDKNKLKLKYKNKEGKVEAQVEKETRDSKEKLEGQDAIESLESLFDQLALTSEMTKEQITESIFTQLKIDQNQLKVLEIEIQFTNGVEIEIEFESEEDEDEE
jgi:major membrane immunogen (membrane-anchored lipoprotein)